MPKHIEYKQRREKPKPTETEKLEAEAVTQKLKKALWQWYGTTAVPAEWDGNVYGGGKISQRFWEYFVTIDMLDLDPYSVVLDIGGGSPATGLSLFPQLLGYCDVDTIVMDKCAASPTDNVKIVNEHASYATLVEVLHRHPEITHISCVSVLEHASFEQQRGIFDAIDQEFEGLAAVFTLEFHETGVHFEQQLTTKTLSDAVSGLNSLYLERIERSPVNCVNTINPHGARLWYPLALRFMRT
jgi:hypothetical protein